MDEEDLQIRGATYGAFVSLGRAPRPDEVAERTARSPDDVAAAWRRLHDAHALVLHADGSLRMANPFSAVPTPYVVEAGGRSWFGNCAWDAVGICAALHVDGDIATRCRCCGEEIELGIREAAPTDPSLRFHCLVPAAAWWEDIGFT